MTRRTRSAIVVAALLGLAPGNGHAAVAGPCGGLLPPTAGSVAPGRLLRLDDLMGLRDVGFPDAALRSTVSPLAVSPDGRQFAFVLTRADAASNSYCRALVTADVRASTRARMLDQGGELIRILTVVRGLYQISGYPEVVTPIWSPDGSQIAYQRRDQGVTQAWIVPAAGGAAVQVTHDPADIEGLAWTADGKSLVVGSRPGKVAEAAAIAGEGRSGYLYDDRVVAYSGPRPQIRESSAPETYEVVNLANGVSRPAKADEAKRVVGGDSMHMPDLVAVRADVARAIIQASGDRGGVVAIGGPGGAGLTPCRLDICRGAIRGMWWTSGQGDLLILKQEGWRDEQTVLYRWHPGAHRARSVLRTLDALQNCVAAGTGLLCTRENATTPRQIVLIDTVTGRSTLVLDLNPEFRSIALGAVRRLRWKNDRGLAAWGDLVLPPSYQEGAKLPLVIVQYRSEGFLRGGIGDEFPIFLFAAHGMAVLSLETPYSVASLATRGDATDHATLNNRDWAERRSLLSSLDAGIRAAIATGTVDPARIGISGLSDGSSTVRFALINMPVFKAAAIGTCCLDPETVMTAGGIRWAEFNRRTGYPDLVHPGPQYWQPYSLALNAARIDTPLLMQLPDDEYLMSLEAFEALREHDKPVELYVFPGEYHDKWQPVHKRAVWTRAVDWFDFWLQDREDPDPTKNAQYRRWERMRRAATLPDEEGTRTAD
jgi:dipeptidyl aminopeptidase/acylaminoacyl peptidase